MQYKVNSTNTFTEVFAKIIVIINYIAIVYFFDTMCYNILEYLLTTSFKNKELFSLDSTYFNIIKINNGKILYLYYLV